MLGWTDFHFLNDRSTGTAIGFFNGDEATSQTYWVVTGRDLGVGIFKGRTDTDSVNGKIAFGIFALRSCPDKD